jgi:O-antigen/teichoic acid export membrane protein
MLKRILSNLYRNNNILSLLSNVSITVFGFVSFILLARTLSQLEFGYYLLYVTAATLIEMGRSGLTRIAIIRFISGATDREREETIGANWFISIVLTLAIVLLLLIVRLLFAQAVSRSDFYLFLVWYPVLAIVNLPYNNVLTHLQAAQDFSQIMKLRIAESAAFVLFLLVNIYLRTGVQTIVIAQIAITLAISLYSFYRGWDELIHIRKMTMHTVKKLLHYSKYTLGTLIGSNLLKSTDSFIIGAHTLLGAQAVAQYGVPLKMIEILEVPLRSLVATAFPAISEAARKGNVRLVEKKFHAYAGFTTLIFIPIILVSFLVTDLMIIILAGPEYLPSNILFKIFCLYGLLLPIDRFTGVVLDSLNVPKLNFFKVMVMATVNLIGDLIAVFIFQSLIGVAISTLVMTLAGVVWGVHFLNRYIHISFQVMLHEGVERISGLYRNLAKKQETHAAR